ncbi:hypothetical protein [Paraliomyxa miuraensis]|uniref:hypothetical protein n=1 Tax=Paraliomyxa miuraensis TaxID=376150 RepID=UPI00224DC2D4|nr:hypothetical protein [Paraliomyxa miuraensis]MCX4241019.1 hypothetical protein [Paraliomyxa miuraensis]
MASEGAAEQGYDEALEAEPPPLPGSAVLELRLTRPRPMVDELQERLEGMLAAMGLELELGQAAAWARHAYTMESSPEGRASIAELRPGLVVCYDAWFDDLSVVDTTRLTEDGGAVDAVPWDVAGSAIDELVTQGILDTSLSYDDVTTSYVRSGVKGPDGTHDEWVDEIRFEANGTLDGTVILDAGVRIGVTPKQRVSSLRVNRIEIERFEPSVVAASELDVRRSFARHVAESTGANVESVLVSARRTVYMLDPQSPSAIVAPRYMLDYAITVGTGNDDRMGSRATMVLLSLTSAPPVVEQELP